MKKQLLFASLLFAGSSFGQIFSEDFESVTAPALPAGWSQVTAATDGGFNTSSDLTSQFFGFPAHTQYVGTNDDICNCDKANEQLTSSAIAIPATGTHVASFEYILGAYYGETGEFGVSTDGGTTFTSLATLDPTNGGGDHVWTNASFNLSAYAGQTVNLVWMYHDNADWGSGLIIDDVSVFALPAVDMEMTALTMNPTIVAGNATVSGTVTSLGADNITSIDVTWNDGSGLNSETFTVNLNYGDTYNFSHGTTLTAVAGQTYSLDVCVVATSDVDASNDCMTGSVSAVSQIVNKVTVGEEKTGEWCGWCPRGAVALANMSISNPNDFIGIAVHNADDMAIAAYDGSIGNYIPGGYPGAGVDRVVDGDPGDFASMHASRAGMVPPASISVATDADANTVTVTVTSDFVGGLTGDYRLAAVLVEDAVSGSGQVNYYNDGSAGALAYPNAGSMPNLNWVGAGATVSPVLHDHVAVALGDNQINGAAGSLPGTLSDGDSESHTYTFTRNSAWKISDMHAVGMLVNASTGEILNAGKASFDTQGLISQEAANFEISAMPNPTNGVSNIVVELKTAAEMNLVIVDVLGNEVYNNGNQTLEAGTHSTKVDLSNNAEGVYFAKVNLNGTVKTIKINVVK